MSVKGKSGSGVIDRLEAGRDRLAEKTGTEAFAHKTEEKTAEGMRTLRSGQMTGRFTMMIRVAVTLAVGVLIVGQIFNALPAVDGPLGNASDQVESLTGTAFELAPIILIVVVASLVIQIVRGL